MTHHSPQSRRRAARAATAEVGMTLVEMLVVLFIVTGLVGGGAYMAGLMTHSNLKEEAMRFASTAQYTYEQAALNNRQYRLVIDLDSGEYHTEVTEADVVIDESSQEAETAYEEGMLPDEVRQQKARQQKEDGDMFDDEEHDPFGVSRRTSYQKVDNQLVEPRELGGQIEFEKVLIETRDKPFRNGRTAIHFFPDGMQQQAYVVLHDKASGAKFTLVTEPLTGRVKIHSGEEEVPENFGEEETDEMF